MAYAPPAAPRLTATGVSIRVPRRELVTGLDLDCEGGAFVGILGANGAGKSMTLRTLAMLREAAAGRVEINGRVRSQWRRRDMARWLGMLPQATEDPFPASVLETVLIGRHPHLDFWEWEGEADLQYARDALARVDLAGMESRDLDSLSGGERRRVAIAALLAQDPRIAILDEPTNHLDPQHQLAVLEVFAAQARDGGAVIASLHDPTLAARHADRVLLLHGDGRWQAGPATRLLEAATLSELYLTRMIEVERDGRRIFAAA